MTDLIRIVDYCALEVGRQHAGYDHVAPMVDAWILAMQKYHSQIETVNPVFDLYDIQQFAGIIEDKNRGFRQFPVNVGGNEKLRYDRVPRALEQLVEAWFDGSYIGYANDEHTIDRLIADIVSEAYYTKSQARRVQELLKSQTTPTAADVWYKEFEDIHPFVDGNGRTGKILYNWLNGTLKVPTIPFNWWGIANP